MTTDLITLPQEKMWKHHHLTYVIHFQSIIVTTSLTSETLMAYPNIHTHSSFRQFRSFQATFCELLLDDNGCLEVASYSCWARGSARTRSV
jgi:hypothetical protein